MLDEPLPCCGSVLFFVVDISGELVWRRSPVGGWRFPEEKLFQSEAEPRSGNRSGDFLCCTSVITPALMQERNPGSDDPEGSTDHTFDLNKNRSFCAGCRLNKDHTNRMFQ